MITRQTAWVALATLTAAALGFAGARAMATGAPQLSPLTYGGVLTDKDGKPYPSAQDVVLKFYDKVDATTAKCTAPAAQAEAGTGRFSVVLPGECAQAVRDTPDLWSEATVGGGKTVLPRVHVGAVPYALEADSAKVAGSAAAATGALKSAIDGIATDVAALKKAPAGGGGSDVYLYDSAGKKIGRFVQLWSNSPIMGSQSTIVFGSSAIVETSTGYLMQFAFSGVPVTSLIFFENVACLGKAYASFNSVAPGNVAIRGFGPAGHKYYRPAVAKDAAAEKITFSPKSSAPAKNACGTGAAWVEGIALQEATAAELGIPDEISGALHLAP